MYNSKFDLKALSGQLNYDDVNMAHLLGPHWPPTICAMENYCAKSNKTSSTLADAYKQTFGVARSDLHGASADAEAVAQLWLKWNMSKKLA